jgi:cytochrome c-type biogenesis protein CcmH
MTEFWILVTLLLVPGVMILVPPLLKPRIRVGEDLDARNLRIARERLAELETEHAEGRLGDAEFEQAKAELEGNLLDDLRDDGGKRLANDSPSLVTLGLLLVLVPLGAVLLYLNLGSPGVIERVASVPPAGEGGHGQQQASMDELLAKLEAKLKENPDNVEGWFILGRSYMAERRYDQAVRALEETLKRAPDNANVLVSLADALAMRDDGKVSGRPEELLHKALKQDPQSTSALWLLGMARQEQGRYKEAIAYWQQAMPLLKDEPDAVTQLNGLIDQARQMGGLAEADMPATPKPAPAATAEIKLRVTLDPALAGEVSPDDPVFVLAKAVSGPPMPLAAVKKRVADLPLEVTLSDAMAMMPSMRLSNFERVLVQARVAKSGSPMAQSGDLQSQAQETATKAGADLQLVIDGRVP